jgi:hypothetical protein
MEFGARSAIKKRVNAGQLFPIKRNLYSTERHMGSLAEVAKLYPTAIITGLTAFYIHGLTNMVPDAIDLATKRNATRISDPEVKQHFVAKDLIEIGVTTVDYDGTVVRAYDLEAMLFYLLHYGNKMPFDLFKEVIRSYRRHTDELDFGKLQRYSRLLPGGRRNLERMIKEIL